MTRKILLLILIIILLANFSCNSSGESKGVFDKPITGKALSIRVSLVTGGLFLGNSVLLEITNSSSAKASITPIKIKVIYEDGTEKESILTSVSSSSLSPGESIRFTEPTGSYSVPVKIQVSIGDEVFLITT